MAEADLLERLPASGKEPFELPSEYTQLAGTPGVGVVGGRAFRVGVQDWTPEQQTAFEGRQAASEAARQAAQQAALERQQEAWLMNQMAKSAKVDQQLKTIEASLMFTKRRAYDRDVQMLTENNIPIGEAALIAARRNPGAFTPSQLVSLTKAAAPQRTFQPQTFTVTDPTTGKPYGLYATGPTSGRMFPTERPEITGSQRLSALRAEAAMIRDRMKGMTSAAPESTPEGKAAIQRLAQIESALRRAAQATQTSIEPPESDEAGGELIEYDPSSRRLIRRR